MTNEEIVEGDKLIIKFIGYKYRNSSKVWCIYPYDDSSYLRSLGWVKCDDLKFHSSWDWLMPVIEKIEKEYPVLLSIKNKISTFDNTWHICKIEFFSEITGNFQIIKEGVTKIKSVWLAVIEFIKWYNSQKD